ncbi:MAG: DNA polymerase III, subunit gamma and tau [Spirochaetes bacterium RBG_16_49_21]|nr:MAG: DNA polymerase III, subunit gamma and tau [Spirochaetes bacterium RBG_16_49_21]
MAYQVLARKWRPQTFDEVIYQDNVSKTLKNSIEKGRISHAYLFSGPRGVGKTTMARILAKALNCESGPTARPCGQCSNCREIRSTTSFDVIEIDGASNRGIDDIRELRENVNFAPVKSKYKIYIIDEVHMLTPPAFNALLKTLEEPPAHVVFIFATTEVHQIPDTILSRCQKYFFKKIPVDPIIGHLKHIVEREGYRISERALYPIARAAQGSMRDAQSLLDQVISFSDYRQGGAAAGLEIGEADALSILGVVPLESYAKLLASIGGTDAAAVIDEVARVSTLGVDIPRYIDGLLDMLRSVRLLRNGVSVRELLGLSDDEIRMATEASRIFHDEELSLMFRIAVELQGDLKYSGNERLNLEMSLLDMIAVKKSPSLASIVARLEQVSSGAADGPGAPALRPRHGKAEAVSPAAPEKSAASPPGAAIGKEWEDFLNRIKDNKQYLHFILKPASVEMRDDTLCITYPGGGDLSYYSRILEERSLDFIRNELTRQLGKSIRVLIRSGEALPAGPPLNESEIDEKSGPPGDENSIPVPDAEMLPNPAVEEFERPNPTVEKIKDAFHGQIIEKGGP